MQEEYSRLEINRLILEYIQEKKRARRWSLLFKFSFLAVFVYMMSGTVHHSAGFLEMGEGFQTLTNPSKEHTAVVNVMGEISVEEKTNAQDVIGSIKAAFKNKKAQALILNINSPGGSAVQSREIWEAIKTLKAEHAKPVYAVIGDLGASGAYLIATAADAIYADETSLLGSIGVVLSSFGFVDTMKNWGIERRLYTAGKNKAFLDPFSPKQPEVEARVNTMLVNVHQAFIKNVEAGRQGKLKKTGTDLFSGMVWTGAEAKELGLIDDFGDSYHVAKEIVKQPCLVDYGPYEDVWMRLRKGFQSVLKGTFKTGLWAGFVN